MLRKRGHPTTPEVRRIRPRGVISGDRRMEAPFLRVEYEYESWGCGGQVLN